MVGDFLCNVNKVVSIADFVPINKNQKNFRKIENIFYFRKYG